MVFILGPIAIPTVCYSLLLCMFYISSVFSVVCCLLLVVVLKSEFMFREYRSVHAN